MNNNLNDLKITSRPDFSKFLYQLHKDLTDNPSAWHNDKLGDFLLAMAALSEDMQGYYDNTSQSIDSEKADWQIFANILIAAIIYE